MIFEIIGFVCAIDGLMFFSSCPSITEKIIDRFF
jgi:hypothetical protein